ncbi:collagen binding domain-containing protein [Curtobacterium sp. CT11-133]|uniref:collagen binding domain-containing protein n=2 Tax=unclassified Curtobacterium TaxID=257496 RepID=UPI0039B106E2
MHHHPVRSRDRRGSVLLAAGIAAVAAIAAGISAAVPASAAAEYTTNATIDGLRFTSQTVTSGSAAELSGTWSLPDSPTTPAGFVVDLPPELQGRSDGFPLLAPDGSAMGRCTVSSTQLDCAVDSAYVAAHPNDLHGSFSFWVTVETTTESATPTTYQVGGTAVTTTVEPAQPGTGPGTCTVDCTFTGRTSGKWGSYDAAAGVVEWTVAIGSGADGMRDGQRITVTDTPGPDQELLTSFRGYPFATLWQTNRTTTWDDGREGLTGWAPASREDYASTAGSVTFTARQGYFYDVHFATRVTDGGLAGTYTNTATISIDGDDDSSVSGTVVHQGGGASGAGTAPTSTPTPTPTAPATVEPTPTPTPTAPAAVGVGATATPGASTADEETESPVPTAIGAAVDTGGTTSDSTAPWWSVALLGSGGMTLLLVLGVLAARTRARTRP